MKENNELERSDIVVLRDMEIDDESGQEIIAYLETWFDVDKKFGTDTATDDEKWLNLYAKYNPFADTLRLEYFISKDAECEEGEYTPTEAEAALIKEMVTEKIQQEYGQSPQEFCNYYNDLQTRNTIGGM